MLCEPRSHRSRRSPPRRDSTAIWQRETLAWPKPLPRRVQSLWTVDAGKALLIAESRMRRMFELASHAARYLGIHAQLRGTGGHVQVNDLEPIQSPCAMSMRRPAICCALTPRSSSVLCGPVIGSQATGVTRTMAHVGRRCSLPSIDRARLTFP